MANVAVVRANHSGHRARHAGTGATPIEERAMASPRSESRAETTNPDPSATRGTVPAATVPRKAPTPHRTRSLPAEKASGRRQTAAADTRKSAAVTSPAKVPPVTKPRRQSALATAGGGDLCWVVGRCKRLALRRRRLDTRSVDPHGWLKKGACAIIPRPASQALGGRARNAEQQHEGT